MTKQEAIDYFKHRLELSKNEPGHVGRTGKQYQAFKMAIEALETYEDSVQTDCISRADALAVIERNDYRLQGKGATKAVLKMQIEELPSVQPERTAEWIPVKYHYITDEEREREGYSEDWAYYLDCEMPDDGQEIIVTDGAGYVCFDICYYEDGYSLDSGGDWRDIKAWMPLPKPADTRYT